MTNQEVVSESSVSVRHANFVYLISTLLQFGIAIFTVIVYYIVTDIFRQKISEDTFNILSTPLVEIVAVLLPVLALLLITKINYKEALKLNKICLKHIIPLIMIGIGMQFVGMFLNNIVIFLLQRIGKVPASNISVPENWLQLIILIIIVGAFPAICEELLSRGLVLGAYEKFGFFKSIVISAFLFGMMHYDLTNFLFPMAFGLVLGYVVLRTNSIISSMLVHFTTNSFGMIILYITKPQPIQYYETIKVSDLFQLFLIALISLILIVLSVLYIIKTTKNIREIKTYECRKIFIKDVWPLAITVLILIIAFVSKIMEVTSKPF